MRPYSPLWFTAVLLFCRPLIGAESFSFKDQAGEYLDILDHGKPVARYMYSHDVSSPEKRTINYKPYLHVFDAEGKNPITKGPGGTFPHHRGIFLGWSKLTVGGKTFDRWHMAGGDQVHEKFLRQSGGEKGSFTSLVSWMGTGAAPVLEEERTWVFLTPPKGAYALMEMSSKLKAVAEEVVLNGDPEHAGLQFRPSADVKTSETVYLYPKKDPLPHKDRDYPWVGETFTLGDQSYSVIFFNHPQNPRETPFSAYRDYGRFGAWFKDTIPAGGERTLRVRFLIVNGKMPDAELIQKTYNEFAGTNEPVGAVTLLPAEGTKPAPAKPAEVKSAAETKTPAEKSSAPEKAPATEKSPGAEKGAAGAEKASDKSPSGGKKRAGGGPEFPILKFKLPEPPVLSPEEEIRTFKLPKGFKAEVVASEPLIETPIAMSFDDQGRIYVVEMRGYMHDVDGTGEELPTGRISRLEDTNADGVMDKATVFVDKLVMPRAVMALGDGALVGVPPNLTWYRDTNGDGVADKQEVVTTDFGKEGGQPEHMVNSPTWMLNNWIQLAGHGFRYRFQQGKFISEPITPGGQWGLTQDDWGRPYFNYNSALLHSHLVPPQFYARNPSLASRTGVNANVMKVGTTWPSHPTPGVNRGYTEPTKKADGTMGSATLREDGKLNSVTATCGAAVYRGELFPKEFRGNVFVPEPSGNLVKRLILEEQGGVVSGRNAYEEQEFLTSTDERFRPVNAYTGPDGALYLVDIARGVIQHKAFLTYYLVANIMERKLEAPVNLGRIYRIVPEGTQPKMVKMPKQTAALVEMLQNGNGVVRDTAQRQLVERADLSAKDALVKLVSTGTTAQTRVHALWTLEGLGALTPEVVTAALRDQESKVRVSAVRLADRTLLPELLKLTRDASPEVRLELAFSLSPQISPEVDLALLELLKAGGSPLLGEAVVSGLRGRELEFLEALLKAAASEGKITQTGIYPMLSACVMGQRRSARTGKLLEIIGDLPVGSVLQSALLQGMAGKPLAAGVKPKLIYLESEPTALAGLLAKADAKTKNTLNAIDAQLAWPGKEGVPPPPKVVALNPEQQALFEKGKTVYTGLCAGCHQPGGTGLEGLAPPLLDSDWVLGSVDRPVRILLHGLSGPVPVGSTVWRLEMPALGQLSDEDIAAVLTYVRREWEHTASPISPKEVSTLRETYKSRAKTWTADELKKSVAPVKAG